MRVDVTELRRVLYMAATSDEGKHGAEYDIAADEYSFVWDDYHAVRIPASVLKQLMATVDSYINKVE